MDGGSAILAGLLLGLTSGGHCFWSCASVMGPYLVATDVPGPRARWAAVPAALITLLWYNLGRLVAYLTVGLLVAWLAQRGAQLPVAVQAGARLLMALILALSLIWPSSRHRCWRADLRRTGAFAVGLLQGFSPCPPFLTAVGISLSAASPAAGLLVFLALFFGTALYTLPLAFLQPLRHRAWRTWLVRGAGGLVCLYLVLSAGSLLL